MDPSFKFDAGALGVLPETQAPWEFSGPAITPCEDRSRTPTTTVDQKIRRINVTKQSIVGKKKKEKGDGGGKKKSVGGKPGGKDRSRGERYDEEDDEEEESDGGVSEEEEEDGDGGASEEEEDDGVARSGAGIEEREREEEEEEEEEDEDDERLSEDGSWDDHDDDDDEEEGEKEEEEKKKPRLNGRMGNGKGKGRRNGDGESDEDEDGESDEDEDGGSQEHDTADAESSGSGSESDSEPESEDEKEGPQKKKIGKPLPAGGGVVVQKEAKKTTPERAQDAKSFFAASEGASFSVRSFLELNLSRPLIRACEALGYERPTPIQAACIPLALTGRDICGSAITGSGKTAAFALPVLERLLFRPRRIAATRVLVLTPTRELAVQVHSMMEKLAQFTDIRSCLVVGGLSNKAQETALRTRPDIVIATPGRMIDHLHNTQSVGLEDLAVLILDEADRLLGMGFTQEVHELVSMCPTKRQTLLFSATMTEQVDELIKLSLNDPIRLSADPKSQRPKTLAEEVVKIRPSQEGDKEAILLAICTRSLTKGTIIFCQTKVEAHRLKLIFGLAGLKAGELHGNLSQTARLEALEDFRKHEVDFLIATDVAARGLDIIGVESVINFDCPRDITQYVHRVGRTARAGRKGCAVTFVTEKERALLKSMAKRAGSQLKSRVVPPLTVAKCGHKIENMETDIVSILQEEREEKILRKAEMEANKAQNMIEHEEEIYSRPKKIWFQTGREKAAVAEAAKANVIGKEKKVKTLAEAEAEKKKEKRKREKEKTLTRKQRRRLEAQREEAEDMEMEDADEEGEGGDEKSQKQEGRNKKAANGDGKPGRKLMDIAYGRAKSLKSEMRHMGSAKVRVLEQKEKLKKKLKEKEKKQKLRNKMTEDGGDGVKKDGAKIDVKHGAEVRSSYVPRTAHAKKAKTGKKGNKSFKSKSRYKRRK